MRHNFQSELSACYISSVNGPKLVFLPRQVVSFALLLLYASSLSLAFEPVVVEEMGLAEATAFQNPLFVDPQSTQNLREKFIRELRQVGKNNRQLVEIFLSVIGSNGVLDGIETVWPKCHSEAHDLGKVIFARVRDVGMGLNICKDRCNSGCMHGLLMEALTTTGEASIHHLNLTIIGPVIKDLCQNPVMIASYSPGDCAHGIGHALMDLSGFEIHQAINACRTNESQALEYYCATGAYMEYMAGRDHQDARTKSILYPCDQYIYPTACARYKMVHVIRRHYDAGGTMNELRTLCASFAGAVRRGCFHGLGNAHMPLIAAGKTDIRSLCLNLNKEEEFVCIDGAIERMAKYHQDTAVRVCNQLDGENKTTCFAAVSRKMYDMKKDLSLYLEK